MLHRKRSCSSFDGFSTTAIVWDGKMHSYICLVDHLETFDLRTKGRFRDSAQYCIKGKYLCEY